MGAAHESGVLVETLYSYYFTKLYQDADERVENANKELHHLHEMEKTTTEAAKLLRIHERENALLKIVENAKKEMDMALDKLISEPEQDRRPERCSGPLG
jgi:hypothetical protein